MLAGSWYGKRSRSKQFPTMADVDAICSYLPNKGAMGGYEKRQQILVEHTHCVKISLLVCPAAVDVLLRQTSEG